MSLRGFHILFVMATVSLSGFFAYWAYQQYQLTASPSYLWSMIGSLLVGVGFIVYGIMFAKKVKD
ncbi:MAG: hypothetical protein KC900_02655 [Candidatus Omnitrophica bacterium]|nr:hypothetical protein [Candidatus Omnitrophota bacterium]